MRYKKSRKNYPDGILLVADSGKKYVDRYMVLYEPNEYGVFPYLSMSENPTHPQGVGQHGELDQRYSVWGTNDKVIDFETLPTKCQELVNQDLKSYKQGEE